MDCVSLVLCAVSVHSLVGYDGLQQVSCYGNSGARKDGEP